MAAVQFCREDRAWSADRRKSLFLGLWLWHTHGHQSKASLFKFCRLGESGQQGRSASAEGAQTWKTSTDSAPKFSNANQDFTPRSMTELSESCTPVLVDNTRMHAKFGIPSSQAAYQVTSIRKKILNFRRNRFTFNQYIGTGSVGGNVPRFIVVQVSTWYT